MYCDNDIQHPLNFIWSYVGIMRQPTLSDISQTPLSVFLSISSPAPFEIAKTEENLAVSVDRFTILQ